MTFEFTPVLLCVGVVVVRRAIVAVIVSVSTASLLFGVDFDFNFDTFLDLFQEV